MNVAQKKKTIKEDVIEALTTFKKPLSTDDLAKLTQCHNNTIHATISRLIKDGRTIYKKKNIEKGHHTTKYSMNPACKINVKIPVSPEESIAPACKKYTTKMKHEMDMPTRCFHYIMAKRSVTPCDIADLFDIPEDRAAKIIRLAVEEHPNEIKMSVRGIAK